MPVQHHALRGDQRSLPLLMRSAGVAFESSGPMILRMNVERVETIGDDVRAHGGNDRQMVFTSSPRTIASIAHPAVPSAVMATHRRSSSGPTCYGACSDRDSLFVTDNKLLFFWRVRGPIFG